MAIVCCTNTACVKMVVASFMQPGAVYLLGAILSWRPNHVMPRQIALPDFEISFGRHTAGGCRAAHSTLPWL